MARPSVFALAVLRSVPQAGSQLHGLATAIHETSKLEGLVQDKIFRQDLYFRLHVLEMFMPPLWERVEDIPLLSRHYLKRFARDNNKDFKGISDQTMQLLQTYPWPGHIHELINVIERAKILSTGDLLKSEALPPHVVNYSPGEKSSDVLKPLSEAEKTHLKQVLSHTQSIEEAAQVLYIDPVTLRRKRKKYQLVSIHKYPFNAIFVSIFRIFCAAYLCTPPHNPLISLTLRKIAHL